MGGVSSAAACLSNAGVVSLPLLLVVHEALLLRRRWWWSALAKWDLFALAAFAAVFRNVRVDAGVGALSLSAGGGAWGAAALRAVWEQTKSVFAPACLAVVYPDTRGDRLDLPALLGVALIASGVVLAWLLRRRPVAVVFVAWFWIGLLPMIGHQTLRADRHLYLPALGLFYLAGLGLARVLSDPRLRSAVVPAALVGVGAVGALVFATAAQCQVWHDPLTLWARALEVDPDCLKGRCNLGLELIKRKRYTEAADHLAHAVRLDPVNSEAHHDLGIALAKTGRLARAVRHFRRAVELEPERVEWHNSLGKALLDSGRPAEAESAYRRGLRLEADSARAHSGLAWALAGQGEVDQSIRHLQRALELDPNLAEARYGLVRILCLESRYTEAARVLRDGLRVSPADVGAANLLARLLATCPEDEVRDGGQAVRLAERVCQATENNNPQALDTLAAAQAEVSDFEEAVQTARLAMARARATGKDGLARAIEARLGAYLGGKPCRESTPMAAEWQTRDAGR